MQLTIYKATEEELATLQLYNGENSLANYHYLQFMRGPLPFDQRVGRAEYVNLDKTCFVSCGFNTRTTAFSNNIMRAGKHYVSFTTHNNSERAIAYGTNLMLGVIRPGKANQRASGSPLYKQFFQNFSQYTAHDGEHNNAIQCCMYESLLGYCYTSDWGDNDRPINKTWDGMESMSSGDLKSQEIIWCGRHP